MTDRLIIIIVIIKYIDIFHLYTMTYTIITKASILLICLDLIMHVNMKSLSWDRLKVRFLKIAELLSHLTIAEW